MATAQDRFTRLYEEHYDAVERYVRRRVDDAVVRDVVAEVFLVVWRRFDEKGMIADVYTMNPDGTDVKQITDFGSMSWAPYEHPSGQYFIFSSNKHGYENFELFIVDAQGAKEPVRITYSGGFDGLPVPSPDGRQLAWTSGRSGDGAQIFLAQWNHEKALEALKNAPPRKSPPR